MNTSQRTAYRAAAVIFKPLAIGIAIFGLTACGATSIKGLWPGFDNNDPALDTNNSQSPAVVEQPEETEAFKYGFQRDDKTSEDDALIKRFDIDRSNLDHAITNTKELIATSYGKPFLPELYIRLAELYAEKSRVVYFLRRLEMGERGKMREISSVEASGLKEKSIETYLQIVGHFPKFEELDKVHFYLAHEFRELAKYEKMAEQYQIILDQFSESEFVPESLLLLGDHAYEDKDIDKALSYYRRVLNYPQSSAVAIARYKLAWVYINKHNYRRALTLFEESVNNKNVVSTVDVDTYNRVDIRMEALADMAFTYSQVYKNTKPGDDSKYFQKIAWSRQSYMLVMEKLANRYLIKHKWDNAAHIYRELAQIQFDGDKLLEYVENLHTCLLESKNYKHSQNDVQLIVKALEQMRYSVHGDDEEKQRHTNNFEIYARDVATRLHERAKSTKQQADFETAANVYEQYLSFFDEGPAHAKMELNYAESLFAAGDYTRAGKIYERIASTIEDPKSKHDPLYSAAVAYYTALDNPDNLNYYQIAYSQDGLRDVGRTYASLYPNSKHAPDILFNIARIRYDKGEFDEAVAEFSDFVKRYPKGEKAKVAVGLMLDALNLTENYAAIVDLQQQLASNPQLGADVKNEIAKVGKAAQSKIIQEMVVTSINDWESGKEKLLNFADNAQTAGLNIQALNALFASSKEHGDIETMHATGQSIIGRFPKSEHAENVLKVLIDVSLSTGQYRVLADYLEQYVQQFPKSENSSEFIYQAAQIRGTLKQYSLATKNYRTLLDEYHLSRAAKESAVLELIDIHIESGELETAYQVLNRHKHAVNLAARSSLGAELDYYTNRVGAAQKNLRIAKRLQSEGEVSSKYYEPLGRTAYAVANRSYGRYMDIKLGSSIDNNLVQAKTEQLEHLQKSYLSVINFKSPRWSVLACQRLYEINMEYANFLESAPIPGDFSAEEIAEYRQIISEQALGYKNDAVQYLNTGKDLAQRLKPFDRQVASYDSATKSRSSRQHSFTQRTKQNQIGLESLKDPTFRAIIDALFRSPSDIDLQIKLAKKYKAQGDLGQSLAVAKNLLVDKRRLGSQRRSEVYALMGAIYINLGQDLLARDALQKSFDIDKNYAATVNLAGLYYHYGYESYANGIYSKRSGVKSKDDAELILARAEGFFSVTP